MDGKSIFNATMCIIGIAFLLIHSFDLILKKEKRGDEKNLLIFFIFTAVHFATYLAFTIIKVNYTSDNFIKAFYTVFYIFNNIEAALLFVYTVSYISLKKKTRNILLIVNTAFFLTFVILDIINLFYPMFFKAEGGAYIRTNTMIFCQGYQFIAFAMVFVLTVFNKKTIMNEKIAFSIYCLLPVVAIILQNVFAGYAIAYLSIIIAIEILFLFVNVKKNSLLLEEAKRTKEAEIKIMMSQIQPHFIYNTLASISTLIKLDPDKAQTALDDFTEYLRLNLSTLTDTGLIFFSDELKHIETYISLEKMRFNERLNVVYDIQVRDFLVPPLSIQPIVENAVKHGILQKVEGGTITLRTYEHNNSYIIEVSDDGVGFDPAGLKRGDSKHIGLNNVKYRISTMSHGEMKIKSALNKGTKITVILYK